MCPPRSPTGAERQRNLSGRRGAASAGVRSSLCRRRGTSARWTERKSIPRTRGPRGNPRASSSTRRPRPGRLGGPWTRPCRPTAGDRGLPTRRARPGRTRFRGRPRDPCPGRTGGASGSRPRWTPAPGCTQARCRCNPSLGTSPRRSAICSPAASPAAPTSGARPR